MVALSRFLLSLASVPHPGSGGTQQSARPGVLEAKWRCPVLGSRGMRPGTGRSGEGPLQVQASGCAPGQGAALCQNRSG